MRVFRFSVLKLATVLEECITEEQRSLVRVCGQKDSMQRIFINKCFQFTMGSVCRIKRCKTGWQMFRWWRRVWNGGAELAETPVKRYVCGGFRRDGTSMSMLVEHTFYFHLWPIYWLSPVHFLYFWKWKSYRFLPVYTVLRVISSYREWI
jgi:hypothetical protein